MRQPPIVLVLHNIPRANDSGERPSAWQESDAGVLDEVQAVNAALRRLGMCYRTVGITQLSELPEILAASPETAVFNLVEDLKGQPFDATLVPSICHAYGKVCTGSETHCLMLAQDKWRSKAILRAAGLECPWGMLVSVGEMLDPGKLPAGRYIVKPAFGDASEGIDADSVVSETMPARAAVRRVHERFKYPALVERFIGHREVNVSLLQRGDKLEVLPISEIEFRDFGRKRPRIVGYLAKWLPGSFEFQHTSRIIPAPLRVSEATRVRDIAIRAWKALGCRDYARVDFRLDADGRAFVLEVNPNPDISPDDGFPAALQAAEFSYDSFVDTLLSSAMGRLSPDQETRRSIESTTERRFGSIRIRNTRLEDRAPILCLLRETGRFRAPELLVAKMVLDAALKDVGRRQYRSLVADEGGSPVGWICFGPTSCTVGTFDIYWLAVAPRWQRRGIAQGLMRLAEEFIRRSHGRMIVIETSGRSDYLPARALYHKQGFREVSRVRDFYAPGDNKVTYAKSLMEGSSRQGSEWDAKAISASM